MRAVLALAVALASALVSAGCGYRFAASGDPLPEGVNRVRAPLFTNRTQEPGLETVFTQALRGELMRAGISTSANAESELQGELLNVWGGPTILTTPSVQGEVSTLASYRVFAVVRLRLVTNGRVLKEADVSGSEDYLPGQDLLRAEANRQAALQRLADRLMREGYDRLRVRG